MTTVTIYSRPGCGACIFTKRAFELARIPHRVRDVDSYADAAAEAQRISAEAGTTQLPVVVCDDGQIWTGLQLDRIAELVRQADEVRRAWEPVESAHDYDWGRERHHEVRERVGASAP